MVLSFVDALDEAFSELLSTKSNKESTVSFPRELLENKLCGARIMAESPFLLTCCCRAVVVTEAGLIYPLPSMRCEEDTSLLRTNLTNTRLLKTNSKMLTLPLALCR